MEAYLPLFPLNLVAFPNEPLNLHIFEPRYKQLVKDVMASDKRFGIPSFVNRSIEYGTEMEIVKLEKEYEDGRMDIVTVGKKIFKVIELHNPASNKLYAAGKVVFIENDDEIDFAVRMRMKEMIVELYQILNLKDIAIPENITSFDVAHKIGLSLEEEYEFFQIPSERQRQEFIITHLTKAVPMLKNIERTKEIIKMNGHFKSFGPLNF